MVLPLLKKNQIAKGLLIGLKQDNLNRHFLKLKKMKYITLILLLVTGYSIAQIPNLPEDISPLLIGEELPELKLKQADSSEIGIKEIVAKKPTVMLFYRGGWCPYCNAHLSDIQGIENEIIELGYQIVGISPDSPENLKVTETEKDIHYQLFSDASGGFIQAMGIGFKAPERYNGLLSKKSGGLNKHTILPVPSVFVVSTNGKILFEYINPDYTTRLSGKLLLSILKNI